MDKALKLYEKAAEAAGKADLVKRIIALHEEDEDNSAENEHLSTLSAENQQKEPLTNINQENMKVSDGDVRFSLKGINKDGVEVYETSEEIKKLPYKERQKLFLDIIKNEYRGRTAKFFRNGHSYYASFDYRDINKNIYGDKLSDKKGWKAKINVGAEGEIFELVEHAKYSGSKPESGKTVSAHSGVEYWDYFIKHVQIDGTVFNLLANVRKKTDGQFVYSIQLNENKKIEASPSLGSPNGVLNRMLNASTDNSITDSAEKVNSDTKLSRKTVQDRSTLTKGEAQKQKANYESDKVYTKAEISKMVESLSGLSSIPKRFRTEIVNDIWTAFNSRYSPGQREMHANFLADKIFAKVMQESGDAFDNTSQEDIYDMEREIHKALKKIAREGGSPSTRSKLEAEFNTSEAGYWKKQRDGVVKTSSFFCENLIGKYV